MSSARSLWGVGLAAAAASLNVALLSCAAPTKPAPTGPSSTTARDQAPQPPPAAPAQPARPPKLDFLFEEAPLGSAAGFAVDEPGAADLRVVDDEGGGRVLAMVTAPSKGREAVNRAGLVLGREAVAALRGRRVTVTAKLKLSAARARFGMIGLDLQRQGGELLRSRSGKVYDDQWQTVRLTVDLPADVENLGVWFLQSAAGEVQLDELRLRDAGPPGAGDRAPRATTARGLQNLAALARLYGVVRYFHPSDEAAGANWERLLLEAIEPVEAAADARELAERLAAVFRPVAPTLTIAAGEQAPPVAISQERPLGLHSTPLRWWHRGVQLPSSPGLLYRSQRAMSLGGPSEIVAQVLDVSARRGETLQLSAFARVAGKGNVLVLASTQKEDEPAYALVRPAAQRGAWTQIKLAVKIPADADRLAVMVRMAGPGQVTLDDASLRGEDGKELLMNGDFEQDSGTLFPYRWATVVADEGYQLRLERKACHGGKGCALLRSVATATAKPGEVAVMKLPGGVTAAVPLVVWSLYVDDHTSKTSPPGDGFQPSSEAHYATVTDRSTRLATVMELWNVLQHFAPTFDEGKGGWMAQLQPALAAAATAAGEPQLTELLERMTHELRDGQANVFYAHDYRGELPLLLRRVEGRWMIAGTAPGAKAGALSGGEELLAINGKPVEELAAALRPRVSAATRGYEEVAVAQRLLVGHNQKSAALRLRRASGGEFTGAVDYQEAMTVREAGRPATSTELEPGIWYVDATALDDRWLAAALPKLAEARGVVIDLRGAADQLRVFEHLTDKPLAGPWRITPITTRPDREGTQLSRENAALAATAPKLKGKIVVLADGRTAGEAEGALSIIKRHKLATIVGEPSAGASGAVNFIGLSSGHTVSWTGQRVQAQAGGPHDVAGIAPDVQVTPSLAGVRARRDEQLERGLELIRGPKAATAPTP